MGYIKQLSEDLIKKIAAGEVIERPASVVKELVENSIDAGATKIEIEIERSGKYIKVSDNGMGIEPDDINLLFARNATSKIKNFNDLWNMDTLGFRGEALASISAVSKVTCRSKHIDQDYGFEIKEIDGKINKKSSAISIGTIFEIDDLFYNVPARQKFLKAESTEYGHIYDIIISLALSHPKVSLTLTNNKNTVLKTSGPNDLKQIICETLGDDLQNKLISVSGKNDFFEFKGFLSALEVFRNDRKSLFVFVNNRPVKCQIISKAVLSAFDGLLPPGKFPVVVLSLTFKPKFVDINVHPTKKEVRYTNPNDVYKLILHSVQNAVSDYYKKEYEDKSVYALPERKAETVLETTRLSPSYTEAAFKFYTPEQKNKEAEMQGSKEVEIANVTEYNIFSIPNVKCKIIYSDKSIANMTKIGNKTIFEVGSIFENNTQVVFSGEIIGEPVYQKEFFNYLSTLSSSIYKMFSSSQPVIQKKVVLNELDNEEIKETKRKKPLESILYKIWERDNWTCVYCGKQLLDPKTVKEALSKAQNGFVTRTNEKKEKVTNHILREHIATYDHYLPVSKLPQFNFDEENLLASCIECNMKKSNSMEQESWKPNRQNSWDKSIEICGLVFSGPQEFNKLLTHK